MTRVCNRRSVCIGGVDVGINRKSASCPASVVNGNGRATVVRRRWLWRQDTHTVDLMKMDSKPMRK